MKSPLLLAALAFAAQAHAAADGAGDFLSSFTGTPVGALDLLAADVSFDPSANSFTLHAKAAGPIAGEPGVAFVFGFDRGGAVNQPFGAIGFGQVRFNATVLLRADGTGVSGGNPVTTAISGNDIFGSLSASLLPGNGAAPEDFTWALWTIDTRISGLPRNADFLGSGNFNVATPVPEPASIAMMLAGLGLIGHLARRRRPDGNGSMRQGGQG
jgi:hypothetical protein